MNRVIKLVIGIPLIGLFSIWLAYMFVGFAVVGLVHLGLPALPGCVIFREPGQFKFPPCPSIFSYSIESFYVIGLLIAIGIFYFLVKLIYQNKQK